MSQTLVFDTSAELRSTAVVRFTPFDNRRGKVLQCQWVRYVSHRCVNICFHRRGVGGCAMRSSIQKESGRMGGRML